jgi:hypothetical protein
MTGSYPAAYRNSLIQGLTKSKPFFIISPMATYHRKIALEAARRRKEMQALRASRWKLREIAAKFGISSERVRQILSAEK